MSICGTCTACCKLLAIEELEKPVGEWCPHCSIGAGCNVYVARPRPCRTYTCLYYQSVEQGTPWPQEMRPDRCRVIIDYLPATNEHHARMDAHRPNAWKAPMVRQALGAIVAQGFPVFLVVGEKRSKLKFAEA